MHLVRGDPNPMCFLVIAIIVGIATIVGFVWYLWRIEWIVNRWARMNGYEITDCDYVSSNAPARLTVRDRSGRVRHVEITPGLWSDPLQVRWLD